MATLVWGGLDKVFANLNREVEKIEGRTVDGLLEAVLLIKAESMRDTPVDTGNLKAGAYVIWGGGRRKMRSQSNPQEGRLGSGKLGTAKRFGRIQSVGAQIAEHHSVISGRMKAYTEPYAEIGFTANYALEVHEALNKNFRVGHAKFLERALLNNQRRVLEIIVRRAKIR